MNFSQFEKLFVKSGISFEVTLLILRFHRPTCIGARPGSSERKGIHSREENNAVEHITAPEAPGSGADRHPMACRAEERNRVIIASRLYACADTENKSTASGSCFNFVKYRSSEVEDRDTRLLKIIKRSRCGKRPKFKLRLVHHLFIWPRIHIRLKPLSALFSWTNIEE